MRPQSTTQYSVQRLCSHHEAAGFDCGVAEWNEKLLLFQSRFDAGDKVLGFVAVAHPLTVAAYIILDEVVLRVPGTRKRVRCFTVPATGVDKDHRHQHLFEDLYERSLNAMAVRQDHARETGGTPYRGLVCFPGKNDVLRRWLESAGFRAFPGNSELVWIELDPDRGPSA